jgi:hypothetical protein
VVGGIRCLQMGINLRNQLSWNKEGKLLQQRLYIIKRLEEQGFVTFATNIFFCAENLKLYKPPSRQIKTKQTFDLFCYEMLQDNEYYS